MHGARVRAPVKNCAGILAFLQLVAMCFLLPGLTRGAALPRDRQREKIGSAITVRDVYVNASVTPLGLAIFSCDVLRTGSVGSATLTLSGKGTFKISPSTQVVFAGDPQYIAELKSGSVVMSSENGIMGINLRAGSSVVVTETEGEQSTSNIEASSNGSFVITCLVGSVGVISLEEPKAIFIQPGLSVNISPQGELTATRSVPQTRDASETGVGLKTSHRRRWILIALAAGGAAVVAGTLSARGAGGSSNGSSGLAGSPTVATTSPLTPTGSASATSSPSTPTGSASATSSSSSSSSTSSSPSPPSNPASPSSPTPPSNPPPPSQPPPGNGCQGHKHHGPNCPSSPDIGIHVVFHF